jgi:hypothetical protein
MYTAKVVASTNNVPTAFDRTAGSLIISSAPSSGNLTIINTTDSILYVVWGFYPGSSVPDSTIPGKMISVPAAPSGGAGVLSADKAKVMQGDSVFIMTDASTARSSGKVVASLL